MRYPQKTYPKAFSVLFGILAAAFILFLICLGVQPTTEPAKLSQTRGFPVGFCQCVRSRRTPAGEQ